MSIYVNVGHNPSDIDKIKQTIEILNFVSNIDNKQDFNIDEDQIADLLDWHVSLLNILLHLTSPAEV
jgi:hypothetical protein